ncbi:MAG: hypothetical protein GF409_01390 [Candidatus Omnitrophica bacterium]|nr:hypothetical protein [Candidatus Omnitrophota bacterium]
MAACLLTVGAEASAGGDISVETVSGKILCVGFTRNGGTVYAGTENGLFLSSDSGMNWLRDEELGTGVRVKRVAFSAKYVYLATDRGLFRKKTTSGQWNIVAGKRETDGVAVCGSASEETVIVWSGKELYEIEDDEWIKQPGRSLWRKIEDLGCLGAAIVVYSGGDIYYSSREEASWKKWNYSSAEEPEENIRKAEEFAEPDTFLRSICVRGQESIYVPTPEEIIMISKKGELLGRISTSGLPSSKVRHLACSGDRLFASTGRRVFSYSSLSNSWRTVFEAVLPGSISCIKAQTTPAGKLILWIGCGNILYRKKIDLRRSDRDCYPLVNGPTVLEVQKMAIEYAEVSPEKIKSWRNGARWKAVLPRLSVSFSESYDDNIEIYKSSSKSYVIEGPREQDSDWRVDLTWDLSDLVWNDAQTSIDVRSRLMVQLREDILEEVTRLYFERRKLLRELAKKQKEYENTPKIRKNLSERSLRLEELTGYIDALTGGAFSESLKSE